eukprot:SAG22_NODE_1957_length_3252_cov_3.620044_1_plen_357_part_10
MATMKHEQLLVHFIGNDRPGRWRHKFVVLDVQGRIKMFSRSSGTRSSTCWQRRVASVHVPGGRGQTAGGMSASGTGAHRLSNLDFAVKTADSTIILRTQSIISRRAWVDMIQQTLCGPSSIGHSAEQSAATATDTTQIRLPAPDTLRKQVPSQSSNRSPMNEFLQPIAALSRTPTMTPPANARRKTESHHTGGRLTPGVLQSSTFPPQRGKSRGGCTKHARDAGKGAARVPQSGFGQAQAEVHSFGNIAIGLPLTKFGRVGIFPGGISSLHTSLGRGGPAPAATKKPQGTPCCPRLSTKRRGSPPWRRPCIGSDERVHRYCADTHTNDRGNVQAGPNARMRMQRDCLQGDPPSHGRG